MGKPIEDYALISDCQSAALIDREGSIDWLSFPRFDSPACFASLVGTNENGRWKISPSEPFTTSRKYIEGTVVLETHFETSKGSCKLIDCLVIEDHTPTLIRMIEGVEGKVELNLELIIRFDYGSIIPWVRRNEKRDGMHAVGGPEALVIYSPLKFRGRNLHTYADFSISEGEKKTFTMMWYPSHEKMPRPLKNPDRVLKKTIRHWKQWSSKCTYKGFEEESVKRSLLTLKALTYNPTGAIIAAPTTSLPEEIGGIRNWDYRYSWIRDSSLTLYALLKAGYKDEAIRWKEWLQRAVAGTPSQVNIMYGIRGERRLTEMELTWLKGFEKSRPVRIGNAAHLQRQLDIFGELLGASYVGMENGIPIDDNSWRIDRKMVDYVCEHWMEPDEGIWEIRAPRKHFTHSKLMAWVALSSAVRIASSNGLKGDIVNWTKLRNQIHQEICERGFNKKLNSFVQTYDSDELDASLLMMPMTNFLPPTDPRIIGTIDAIKRELMIDGHVHRYKNTTQVDGLPGEEGSFMACSFWMVENLRLIGRKDEALEMFRHLQTIKNDVGLFSEEYSTNHQRMLGNFPQALSHISQIVSALGFNQDGQNKESL